MKKNRKAQATSFALIFSNVLLFCIKLAGSMAFGSVALLSDAINSFSDILTYSIAYLSVKISSKEADKDHPYGHHRAQPLAAFLMAVLTAVLGLEILKISIDKIISGETALIAGPVIAILAINIIVKSTMWFFSSRIGKECNSPALESSSIDSRNDVLINIVAIAGVYMASLGYHLFDPIAAFAIGLYIIKAGYDMAMKNMPYLMGESPSEKELAEIEKTAKSVNGVIEVREVKAQHIGNYVQAEIHIAVDKDLTIERGHEIGHIVERKLMKIDKIKECVVHVDPYKE